MEKLSAAERAKVKQLIHNVLKSTKVNNTISEAIIEQRNKLGLEEAVVDKYKVQIRLQIRDTEMECKEEVHLM